MAYDRYDRDEYSRHDERGSGRDWRSDDRGSGRSSGRGGDDRGFFERAGDEISSWFGGGSHDDRHRGQGSGDYGNDRDRGMWRSERSGQDYDRGYGRDYQRDREHGSHGDRHRRDDRDFNRDRSLFSRGGSSDSDYNGGWARNLWGGGDSRSERDRHEQRDRSGGGYRPMTGDYGRGEREMGGYGRDDSQRMRDFHRDSDRSEGPWSRDEARRTSFAGSAKSDRDYDPNYRDWRERHMSEVDRDYHDYRRENQSRFEDDFSGWRNKRQEKRALLGQIREHMDVTGRDGEHVGTVDKVAGDRIILTKDDPASGGRHHSLSCSVVDRVEDNRVILDCSAKDARNQWRDEDRSRALFERPDQGEDGPRALNRSFSGTYRER